MSDKGNVCMCMHDRSMGRAVTGLDPLSPERAPAQAIGLPEEEARGHLHRRPVQHGDGDAEQLGIGARFLWTDGIFWTA